MSLNDLIKIGDRIKTYRKNLNLTQAEMADKVGLPRSTYANYESNSREPNNEILDKIAEALEVSKYDLLYDVDKIKSELKLWEVVDKENPQNYFLEQYIRSLGYEVLHDEEDGYVILKSKEDEYEYEITEKDIEELQTSSRSFIEYKLHELINKSRKIGK